MGLHKIKRLLHNKEMASKLKRPHTEWEKIFASYTSDKRLITRENICQLYIRKRAHNQNIQGTKQTKLSQNQGTNKEI
jgi:hypothetical protein